MLRILMAFAFTFSSAFPAWAGSTKEIHKRTSRHLSDYALTLEQLKRLKPADQAVYVYFLTALVYSVEAAQVRYNVTGTKPVADKKTKTAAIDYEHFFKSIFSAIIPSASGIAPVLVPIGIGAGALARAGAARALPWILRTGSRFINSGTKWAQTVIKNYTPKGAAGIAATKAAVLTSTVYSLTESVHVVGSAQAAETAKPATPPPAKPAAEAAPPATPPTTETASTYKKTGATCIFGGYVSQYGQGADGNYYCMRPENQINRDGCMGTETQPKIMCNSFGLINDPKSAELGVIDALCINLQSENGLKDLTVRCMSALNNWYNKNLPVLAQRDNYNEFITALKTNLDTFEKMRAPNGDVTFADYCASNNAQNNGYQKDECNAILGMIAVLESEVPDLDQAFTKPSESTPSTPAPTAPAKTTPTEV